MRERGWVGAVFAALALLAPALACADSELYAARARTPAASDSEGPAGSLYTVNLANGSATFAAPIRLNGVTQISVTGLAVHPATGVFYGITSPLSPNYPRNLVTIDPNTGNATLIGELGANGSDIAFDTAGKLYMWIPATSQLGIVNTGTGMVSPIGKPGGPGTNAGLAIDKHDVVYITATGASGTLDTVDRKTGAIAPGPQLTGAPFPSAINAMTFTPSGLLLAVNSNSGSPANTRLVTINTSSGAVSLIGTLPDDTDALAFAAGVRGAAGSGLRGQTLGLIVLIGGALLIAIGWAIGVRIKKS